MLRKPPKRRLVHRFYSVAAFSSWRPRKEPVMRRLLCGWNGKRLALAVNLLLIAALALAGAPAHAVRAQTAPGGGNGPAPVPVSGSIQLANGGTPHPIAVTLAGTFDPASSTPHAAAPLAPGATPKPMAI